MQMPIEPKNKVISCLEIILNIREAHRRIVISKISFFVLSQEEADLLQFLSSKLYDGAHCIEVGVTHNSKCLPAIICLPSSGSSLPFILFSCFSFSFFPFIAVSLGQLSVSVQFV